MFGQRFAILAILTSDYHPVFELLAAASVKREDRFATENPCL
jgi:hypothetical protein